MATTRGRLSISVPSRSKTRTAGLLSTCTRTRSRMDRRRVARASEERRWWKNGVVKVGQAQAGHRSIETTRIYLHLSNVWLAGEDLAAARVIARELRGSFDGRVRTLALPVGKRVQVSCNLIDPWTVGPGAVFDFVSSRSEVERCELVGLVPRGVLHAEPPHRWAELGIDPSVTIEARLEQAGLDGGSLDHR